MNEKKLRQKEWGSASLKMAIGIAIFLLVVGLSGCVEQSWQGGVYTDPDGLFSFEAPEGWVIDECEKDFRSKVIFDSADGSIVIIVEPFIYGENVTDEEKERIRSGLTNKGVQFTENIITIDDMNGWLVEFEDSSMSAICKSLCYVKNGYWHSIVYSYKEFSNHDVIWEKLLNSFNNSKKMLQMH